MIYPRELIAKLDPFLKRREYIGIVGPRQSGKTTFLDILRAHLRKTMHLNNSLIQTVTFEDRRLLIQFESDPVKFVKSYIARIKRRNHYLMIDEFQYAVNGGQKLKMIYDTVKDVKIIITGSSSLDIKAKVGKFMVGRILNFHLYPFSFGECLHVHDRRLMNIYNENHDKVMRLFASGKPFRIKRGIDIFAEQMIEQYEQYCIWGGYPAVVTTENREVRRKILAEIYNNYILKDIKTLLELATEQNLYNLSQHLATQISNIVVYQNLGQAAALDYRNLKKHLNILRETFVCHDVKPFFRNRQKELTKNPKIYFIDMGFRNNLIDNFNGLEKRTDAGAMIENAVYIKLNVLFEDTAKIHFWRTKVGAEVDFVLHIAGNIVPVEVKYSKFKEEKISRSTASFIDSFRPKNAIVLTRNYWGLTTHNDTKILFIPVYYL
jgi:predicted AAA+ superfamily ATPase